MIYQAAIQHTLHGDEFILWINQPSKEVKKELSIYYRRKFKGQPEYHFPSEDSLLTAIKLIRRMGAIPSPNQSQRFFEFTIKDFQNQASGITKRYRAERDQLLDLEPQLIRFTKFNINTATLVWKTPPTHGVATIADYRTGKLKKGTDYIMKVQASELDEWIVSYQDKDPLGFPSKDEFFEVFEIQDLKLSCNCAAFHWQGMKWKLSDLKSAIYPIKIPDPIWGPRHNDENGLCKHLLGLINGFDSWKDDIYRRVRKAYTTEIGDNDE